MNNLYLKTNKKTKQYRIGMTHDKKYNISFGILKMK